MDQKSQENPDIQQLIRLSDQARSCLNSEAAELRLKLDVPMRVRNSLRDHPGQWLMGSMGTGLIASLLLRRKPAKEKKSRRFPSTLLGITLTAARPLAKVWLANHAKQWLAARLTPPPAAPPTRRSSSS